MRAVANTLFWFVIYLVLLDAAFEKPAQSGQDDAGTTLSAAPAQDAGLEAAPSQGLRHQKGRGPDGGLGEPCR